MNWISWFGLGIVLLLLIPNAVYAAANKNTQPPRTRRILGLAEQAGRYGCMFLMIFHAGLTEFGFASAEGFIAWLAGTGALLVLYWVFWLLYFRAAKPRYALPLAVLPCLIFLLNGLFLRHWLLVFFSVLFAAAHIAITWQNTRAP